MKRLFTVFFMAVFAMFTSLSGAYAQTSSEWTINITADQTAPISVPAGTEININANINHAGNTASAPTTVEFTVPKSVIFNTFEIDEDILSNCNVAPSKDEEIIDERVIKCDVRSFEKSETATAKISFTPQTEGVIRFLGTVVGNGTSEAVQITVTKGADLALALETPAQVKGGGKIDFSAIITNNGPYSSTDSKLTFPVPTGVKLNEPLPNGCGISGSDIVCHITEEIGSGKTLKLDFSGVVLVADQSTFQISAGVTGNTPKDPDISNNSALATIEVLPGTDVGLTKKRTPELVIVGDVVEFTLTPQFAGIEPAQATIKDVLPDNYDFPEVTDLAGTGWICSVTGREVLCEYTKSENTRYLTPIKITTKAIKKTEDSNPVPNTATITSANEDSDNKDNNSANDGGAVIIEPRIDLKAHKQGPRQHHQGLEGADKDKYDNLFVVGEEYEYILQASNLGNIGFFGDLTITDFLPDGMELVSVSAPASWSCGPNTGSPSEIACTTSQYTKDSPLAIGARTDEIKLKVKMIKSGEFTNKMVVSLEGDADLSNNTAETTGKSGSGDDQDTLADLEAFKTVSKQTVKAGEEIKFDIEIVNNGGATATSVFMTDRIENIVAGPKGGKAAVTLSIKNGDAKNLTCEAPPSGGYYVQLKCRIDELPVCKRNENCPVVTVSAFAGYEGDQLNTAHVYSTEVPDPKPGNNDSRVEYNVTPVTDVTVIKKSKSERDGVAAGQDLVYTIAAVVEDNGLSGAENVVIEDDLPLDVRFVRIDAKDGLCTTTLKEGDLVEASNRRVRCEWDKIEHNAEKEISITVKPSTAQLLTTLVNEATVRTSTEETDTSNNHDSVSVKVLAPDVDLLVSKTDTVGNKQYDPVEKGLNTTYLIAAKNDGPSDAYNVEIVDTFPADGFSYDQVKDASAGLICVPTGVAADQAGGTLTCSIPVLKAGSEVQFKVDMKSLARGTYKNKVEVISDETRQGYDRNPGNNTDDETTTVRVKSDVSVVKTANEKVVDLRESFTWTLTVESHSGPGLEVAENVILTDTLPEGMVLTKEPRIVSGKGGSCVGVVGQRTIRCELGDMEPTDTTEIELTTKIIDTKAETKTNAASVTTDSYDQDLSNNTDDDSVTTVRGATVSGKIFKDFNEDTNEDADDAGVSGVTVTLTGNAKHDGEQLSFTLTTDSDGNYKFTDIPAGEYQVSYSNVPDSGKYKTGVSVPGNNANGSHSTSVNNTTLGSIIIEEDKSSIENNFTLIPLPSIGLSKVAGTPVAAADGTYTIEYTFTAKNLSQEPLKDIALTDILNGSSQNFGSHSTDAVPLPGFYSVQSVDSNVGTLSSAFNGATNTLIVDNAVLQPDATLVAKVVLRVNPEKPWKANPLVLTNQADVTAVGELSGKTNITDKSDNRPGGEDHPDRNVPTTVTLETEAKIKLEKTSDRVDGTKNMVAGDEVTYSFTVTNTGSTPLFDVVITDPMVDLVWTDKNAKIAKLDIGESDSTTFKATYVLQQSDIDKGILTNTAQTEGLWGEFDGKPQVVTDISTVEFPLGESDLTFEKKLKEFNDTEPSKVGDKVVYEFTVTNSGNTTLTDVVITDELADVVDSGAFNIGTLAPKETKTVEAYYLLKLQDINAGKVINKALASGTPPSGEEFSTPPSEVTVPLHREPKLTLVKALSSVVPDPAYAGDMLEWTIKATNDGNVTLTNIKLSDPLTDAEIAPEALTSLEPGESGTFTVKAPIQQEHLNAGQVINTAKADFEDPTGPQQPVDSNEVVTPLAHKPSISLEKVAILDGLSTPAKVGDELRYSFTIRNTGNVALNGLVLTDNLDGVVLNADDLSRLETLTLQPVNAAKDNDAEVQTVVYGTYKLKVTDINAGKVENTADIKGIPAHGVDKTPVTDDSSTNTPLDRDPSIKLVKTLEASSLPKPAKAGDVIKFNFAVHNTGNVTLKNIRIEDLVTDVQVINQANWTGPLEPGEVNEDTFTATYALKQSDIDAGVFANTAQVYGSSVNGTPDDVTDISGTDLTNDDETVVELETSASITIVKSETHTFSDPSKVDDLITYSFLVTNTGNLTLTNVIVEDPLKGLEPAMPITIATLLPGDANAVTLTATYKVTQTDIENGKVVNQATVTGDYTDPTDKTTKPVTPDVSEEIIVPLSQKPGIAVVKEANSKLTEPAEAGQKIEYTFTVHNTGNMVLNDVVLTDPLQGITPNSFNVGTMQPGEQQVFTATYAITEADIEAEQVINHATVKGTYGDPTTPKDIEDPSGPTVDTDEPTIVPVMPPLPELTIEKSGYWNDANGNGYPEVGETIEYSFDVKNDGNALLNNVTVQDEGPLFNGQRGTNQLSAITPTPVTLKPGDHQTFTATYVLSQADIDAAAGIGMVINTAFAKGDQRNGKPYESKESTKPLPLPATEPSLVKITKQAILHQVRRGDRVPYIIKVENTSSSNAGPVNIIDTMPSGFRFVEGSARLGTEAFIPEVNGRRISFKDLKLGPNSTIEIRLELLVLSSAGPGKHINIATVTDKDGKPVAPDAQALVEIMSEPVFDCGEIIGTVFDDKNRNGYQDEGEKGLAGVRVATVKGWLITTDEYGRFHVPCAALPDQRIGSNFIMKLDTRTLPTGYRLTTENPRVVRLTAGKMTKLNFGASISRVVRLDLQDAAFEANRVELKKQWADNLPQLVEVLKQEISVLRLSYKMTGNEQSLAKQRMKHVRKQIGDLWKRKGDNYPLEIETRVEVSK